MRVEFTEAVMMVAYVFAFTGQLLAILSLIYIYFTRNREKR